MRTALTVASTIAAYVVLLILLIANPVAAQTPGFYVGVIGGANLLTDSEISIAGGIDVDNDYDPGYAVGGVVGYNLGDVWEIGGLRGEFELMYRHNEIEDHRVAALGGSQPGSVGEVASLSYMVNVYHDFAPRQRFRPYIGFGIGGASNEFQDFGIQAVPQVLDDEDSGFAWQVIAGAGYRFSDNIFLTGDYRYFSTEAEVVSTPATGSVSSSPDVDSHSVLFGLRYQF